MQALAPKMNETEVSSMFLSGYHTCIIVTVFYLYARAKHIYLSLD